MLLVYAYQDSRALQNVFGEPVGEVEGGWRLIARIKPKPGVPARKHPTVLSLNVRYPRLKIVDSPHCKAEPFVLKEDLVSMRCDVGEGASKSVYFLGW